MVRQPFTTPARQSTTRSLFDDAGGDDDDDDDETLDGGEELFRRLCFFFFPTGSTRGAQRQRVSSVHGQVFFFGVCDSDADRGATANGDDDGSWCATRKRIDCGSGDG